MLQNMKTKDSSRFTFIDLFAGCGGLSEGFLNSGVYDALAHVEWEVPMIETLRKRLQTKWNHSEEDVVKNVVHFDIQKTEELIHGEWSDSSTAQYGGLNHDLVMQSGLRGIVGNRKVDVIIGGPPCQAYSIAGRAQDKNSMKDDYRNYLFESFVKVVDEFRPEVFVFENVPGLLSARPGEIPVTERIFSAFHEIGYHIRTPERMRASVYNSSDFGVPQSRKRVIIIGVREDSGIDTEALYAELDSLRNLKLRRTVKDAIGHLPKLLPLKEKKNAGGRNLSHTQDGGEAVHHHEPRFHNERDIGIFRQWITNGMNKSSSAEKIDFYNRLMNRNSNHAKYRNLEWDKPSPTVVAHLYKDGLMFIHPDVAQARSITVKEAALLQSFPDDFEFKGSSGDAFKMIGNAVPPLMAEKIASAVANKLKEGENK
jgi:DNA (cytosine-5)-methyltransferase 1